MQHWSSLKRLRIISDKHMVRAWDLKMFSLSLRLASGAMNTHGFWLPVKMKELVGTDETDVNALWLTIQNYICTWLYIFIENSSCSIFFFDHLLIPTTFVAPYVTTYICLSLYRNDTDHQLTLSRFEIWTYFSYLSACTLLLSLQWISWLLRRTICHPESGHQLRTGRAKFVRQPHFSFLNLTFMSI